MTTGEWLRKSEAYLAGRGVREAEANAEFLMARTLKTGRNEVRLHSGRALAVKQGNHFWHLTLERGRRVPLAYVLGFQPFMGVDILVNREVLIPRPETEEVVEAAARLLRGREAGLHVLEIGTGTGCISVALSRLLPHALIYATDISPAALRLALKNAEAQHRSLQIRFIREDLFKPAGRRGWADLLVSNPPYVPTAVLESLEPEVRAEPRVALDGGQDGLAALRAIIAQGPRYLKPGGWLVLEIGWDQGPAVRSLLEARGFREASVQKDLQGHDRIAVGRKREGV